MTTTELIKILQDNEKGGISHKPRNISLSINGRYMPNPQISLSSTGDGICGPEIDLDIEGEWFEQQPNRCDSCTHSEEQDGSNCYECVKGMTDNFEAQPTDKCKGCYYNDGNAYAECVVCDKKAQPKTGYISINATKLAKEVAEKALDEITYNGKTIREWAEIIVKQQPSEDCISREEALLALTGMDLPTDRDKLIALFTERIQHLPPVTPTNEDIKEAYLKGYDYGVKDWFKSKTQPCEDCISRSELLRHQHIIYDDDEEGYKAVYVKDIKAMPPVTPQRPKGKWIEYKVDIAPHPLHCSLCGFSNHHISNRYMREFRRCPNCGAEMEDSQESEDEE